MRSANIYFTLIILILCFFKATAQETTIKGFADFNTAYSIDDERLYFALGEQDLFITSELSDRVNFLGETVFKFNAHSGTTFNISVERVIIKYNIKGNNWILFGKQHTPMSYWNDSYHHGRVFFPTIFRPMVFSDDIYPIHTNGINLQGLNLTKYNIGYDLMVGNGLGSNDVLDNNRGKSITARIHAQPWTPATDIGVTGYYDRITPGLNIPSHNHGGSDTVSLSQYLYTFYFAHFGKKFEFLTEASFVMNQFDKFENTQTPAGYIYTGYKIKGKFVPYLLFDYIDYDSNELYFENKDKKQQITVGLRYEINYLAVVKLEYSRLYMDKTTTNGLNFQFAVGF